MAPLALPFDPSYTTLKNLHQKLYKYITVTLVNLSLPIKPQDLSTDLTPYLNGAIGILSNSTAVLYNNNAPQAVRVTEVKSEVLAAINRVDIKVDKVKTDVTELKTDIIEIKIEMKLLKNYLESQIDSIRTDINDIKTTINNSRAVQLNSLWKWLNNPI